MERTSQAAAVERLALRLHDLRTVFLAVRSVGQLTEAMTEAGSIFYELMLQGAVPSTDHLLQLGQAGHENAGRMRSADVSDLAFMVLWQQVADMFNHRRRLLLRPAPDVQQPQWTVRISRQAPDQSKPTVTAKTLPATGLLMLTDWGKDYAEQAQRYALSVSEVLATLQHRSGPNAEGKKKGGRPRRTKLSARERRVLEAWGTGRFRKYSECDLAFKLELGTTKLIVNAKQKREKRSQRRTK